MGVLLVKYNGATIKQLDFASLKKAIEFVSNEAYSSNVFEYSTTNSKTRIENTIILKQRESQLLYKSISNN